MNGSRVNGVSSLRDLSVVHPDIFPKLWPFAEALMRGDSPLSSAQRELIAAFVSALNQCNFCYGAHANVARAFGVEEQLVSAMSEDLSTAPVDASLRPLLELARVLTETPPRATDKLYTAIREAGWTDEAISFVISVTAYFNMMNRLVEGLGIELPEDGGSAVGQMLADHGYDRG